MARVPRLSWLEPFGQAPESGPFAEAVARVAAVPGFSEAEAAKVVWCADVERWLADPEIQPAQPWHLWRGAIDYARAVLAGAS